MTDERDLPPLVRWSWKVVESELDEDLKSVWRSMQEEGELPREFMSPPKSPAMEDALVRLMIHPVMRGIYRVISAQHPYPHDTDLRQRVKEWGKERIQKLCQLADCSVKHERWMTFIAPNEEVIDQFVGYLIPTFKMSTLRATVVIDFAELLDVLRRSSQEMGEEKYKERALDLRNTVLMVVRNIDARNPLYARYAGLLVWFFSDRGRRGLATVFVIGPAPTVTTLTGDAQTISMDSVFLLADHAGFREKDQLVYKMFEEESHVTAVVRMQEGSYKYVKIEE